MKYPRPMPYAVAAVAIIAFFFSAFPISAQAQIIYGNQPQINWYPMPAAQTFSQPQAQATVAATTTVSAQVSTSTPEISNTFVEPPYPIDPSRLKGESILVQNLGTGAVLYEKNADKSHPLASITKLVTAITVTNLYKDWKTLPERIKLSAIGTAYTKADRAVSTGGNITIKNLLTYMLMSSSNYAADSLATEIIPLQSFLSFMNFTGKNMGLKNTTFINASGLTEGTGKNARASMGTARDVATVLKTITEKYPELAKPTRTADLTIKTPDGKVVTVENTNKLIDSLPNLYLGKTGYTDEAGGNLAIVVQKNNQYYAIIVLGSTLEARFTDVMYLATSL